MNASILINRGAQKRDDRENFEACEECVKCIHDILFKLVNVVFAAPLMAGMSHDDCTLLDSINPARDVGVL